MEDEGSDMGSTERNFKSIVRTARKEEKEKISHNQSEILEQVFIAK